MEYSASRPLPGPQEFKRRGWVFGSNSTSSVAMEIHLKEQTFEIPVRG
jgi:hypothetical protein